MTHDKINYLEIPSSDFTKTKAFFEHVFDWTFTDYGTDYTAFTNAGIEGGFYKTDLTASTQQGSVLVVFYSQFLEQTQAKIINAGGQIIKPIFSFPGGRRFHFTDLTNNEYAVWSDNE